ncbi:MAG: CinA family protein [Candidatus Limnocylindrales bacterium]
MTEGDPELDLNDLAERLQAIALAAGLTVSTAESCTGGLVAHALTEIAGSSAYFLGGVVAYADATKRAALGVPAELITRHGAVSAQVARAMAAGARRALGSDLAVSVTGIAGPAGGTPAKPVGLTYIAVEGPAGSEVRRYVWPHDRAANKRASAAAAIELLISVARPA